LLGNLRERDYLFGEHFVTVPRGAESQPEHYPGRVAELVRLQDVIVAGRRTLPALKQATSTFPLSWPLPMIRWAVGSSGASDVHAELHEVEQSKIRDDREPTRATQGTRAARGPGGYAVIWGRAEPVEWQAAEAAARDRGWKLLSLGIRDEVEFKGALRAATNARSGGLLCDGGRAPHPSKAGRRRTRRQQQTPSYTSSRSSLSTVG